MSFRETIRREAELRKLSAYRIGKLSGVNIRTVQAYLAGKFDMGGEKLARIADALGLELRPKRRRRDRR